MTTLRRSRPDPGLTGRTIGLSAGAALGVLAACVAFAVRRGRYAALARGASHAGKAVILQDRAVTIRVWRRAHRWWLLGAFLAAVGSSFVLPAAGGLLMAGAAPGLWAKAWWLGRREREQDALLWVRTEAARRGGAAGRGSTARWCPDRGCAARRWPDRALSSREDTPQLRD
ncbi:hypothetical protein AB0C96_19550 [Streptomyces sp. NPDC048506]|uniref:hypothetical protein n=1 Tax=Streptomyces sp. NPDC048506 TaxID=3155028 RepID=UPI00342BA43C